MKNLWFIIWGLFRFRLFKKGDATALVVNTFTESLAGQKALEKYFQLKQKGERVFVLSAFNEAPLGLKLFDYRDIYIFNNNPQILAQFCAENNVSTLVYYDCEVMKSAAIKFGLKVADYMEKE